MNKQKEKLQEEILNFKTPVNVLRNLLNKFP